MAAVDARFETDGAAACSTVETIELTSEVLMDEELDGACGGMLTDDGVGEFGDTGALEACVAREAATAGTAPVAVMGATACDTAGIRTDVSREADSVLD